MNIEEAIKNLKVLIGLEEFNKLSYKENKSIETLLTAYEKEKKKNKKLDKENQGLFELYNFNDSSLLAKILKDYKAIIEKQQKEIERLEARKYMLNAETGEISQIPIDNNYISKDKIKAKVIEIKNRPVKDEFITATHEKLNTIIDIESLLDEEE